MRSTVTSILLIITWSAVLAQQRCPSNLGWAKHGDSCYKFEAFPLLNQNVGEAVCQQDGAHLLSVNSQLEHDFIKEWLLKNDLRRARWVTSGLAQGSSVLWLGDSSTSTTVYYREDMSPANDSNLPIIYAYTGTEYLWDLGTVTAKFAFICEIKLTDVFKIAQEFRDFAYGLNVENAQDAPRGPVFIQQPEDTAILGKNVPKVTLNCLAEANPEPKYTWMMKRDEQWVPVPLGDRYTITTGKLELSKPVESDENEYQCRASNDLGTSLSTAAQLSFGFLGDFSPVASARVTGAEYSGAQIECPPIVGKPAKTYQWYKDSVMFFIRPDFQKHIFMSRNGKLYFSELNISDKGTYYCVVNLFAYGFGDNVDKVSSDGKTSRGFDLDVTSGGGRFYQPEIQNQFPFVFPINPVKDGDVEIECFAYGTGPLIYTWSRVDGKPLPLGHTLHSNGRILYLTKVQLHDSGFYRCHVKSTQTNQEDRAATNLIIQARPFFTYPLAHLHLDVGSRLAWHCEAAGMPEPTYIWYKNGQVLSGDPSSGMAVLRNTLTIESVQVQRDSGMYQCAAQNIYGTTYSTAQLRVLELAPSFEKRPMVKSKTAALGGDVTLICSPVAAPAPTYTWLKDGSDLNLNPSEFENEAAHYQLLRNGNLLVHNLVQSDQGRYTCKVENSMGKASDYTDVLILEGTTISDPPADDKVEVNLTATLLCRGSHDPEIDMVYVWRFNDHIIDFNREPEFRQGEGHMKGSLYIVGAQFVHEGTYTCTATTAMDSQSRSAYLQVLGPPAEPVGVLVKTTAQMKTLPAQPQGVNHAGRDEDTTRWIVWMDGKDHGSAISHYFIEFHTDFDKRWRVHPDGDNIVRSGLKNELFPDFQAAKLTNLKAYTNLEFRVRARNSFGIGNPSLPTKPIKISGTNVSVPVQNIRGGGGSVGVLTIVWDPLPTEDHNGPNLKYVISYRAHHNNSDQQQWITITKKEEEVCKYRVDFLTGHTFPCDYVAVVKEGADLNFYKPYEVKVRGVNDIGIGPDMKPVVIMSAEDLPVGVPEQVKGEWYNGTALLITWRPVPNTREAARGRLKGYKINYWRKDFDRETDALQNIIQLKPGQENLDRGLIIGLEPVEWYRFNVQAYNTAGNGDKSSNYERQTLNREPSQYPTEVHVFSVEGYGVRVNFRGISTQIREEPLRGYKIQYWKAAENLLSAREADLGLTTTGVIRNLSSSELYQLRVFAYSRAGMGRRSSPSIYFTVGDGQIVVNPETTEIMSGASSVQLSVVACVCALVVIWLREWAPN